MAQRVKLHALGPLQRLASGGQGVVHAQGRKRIQYASSLVYKEYKPGILPKLQVAVLDSMPTYLESLPFAAAMELLEHAAWPCALVEEDNSTAVIGFLMPAIPGEFRLDLTMGAQVVTVMSEFQHLLNNEDFLARRNIPLTDRVRFELLAEAADALGILHGNGIAVGDYSPKNLLFALQPDRKVYFIDCDAMRLNRRSALDQVETPGWDVHSVDPQEELATTQSDSYKLGLLTLRLLTGDQATRDPAHLPRHVPDPVRQLVISALTAAAGQRPEPAAWTGPLRDAIATASTRLPQRATPPAPPSPPRHGRTFVPNPPNTVTPAFGTGPTPVTPTPGMPPPGYRGPRRPQFTTRAKVFAGLALAGVVAAFLIGRSGGDEPKSFAGSRVVTGEGAVTSGGVAQVSATVSVGARPWAVAPDPGTGKVFVTNSASNSVSVVDSRSATVAATVPGFSKPTGLVVDAAAHIAYVTNAGGNSVTLLDTQDNVAIGHIPVGAGPYGIAVDTAAHMLYVSNFDADTVSIIDTRSRSVVDTVAAGNHPYGLALDPSTHTLLIADAGPDSAPDRTVTVLDTLRRTVLGTIAVGSQPWGVAVDTDTSTAYVTNHHDGTVSVIDTRRRIVTATLDAGLGPVGVTVDAARHTVYVTNHGVDDARTDNTVTLIDTSSGRSASILRVGIRPHGIAVDPRSGVTYVTNYLSGTVSVVGS